MKCPFSKEEIGQVKEREAGVEVHDMLAEGMPHGYFESGFGENTEGEQDFLGEEVREMRRINKTVSVTKERVSIQIS